MSFIRPARPSLLVLGLSALLLLMSAGWLWWQQQPLPVVDAPVQPAQCVSYAPYYKPGMNPTVAGTQVAPEQIMADLKALSAVTSCVRTYAVSQGLDYVPVAAKQLGMQVLLGVWISWTDADNRAQLETAVTLANQYPHTVKALIIGNEVLLRGEQPEAQIAAYLQWAQAHTEVAITYADVWEYWLKYPMLEKQVDFITVHVLPYWEDLPVPITQAVDHTAQVMARLGHVFTKPLLIGETGWPSEGRQRFGAQPGHVQQARYIREFLHAAQQHHWQYNLIEAVDQPWKRALEGTVGGYWGLLSPDLQAKFPMQGPVAARADGWQPWAVILLTVCLTMAGLRIRAETPISRRQQGLILLIAMLWALHAYLQWHYVSLAARSLQEYALLGGTALLGWAVLWTQVQALALGRAESAARLCLLGYASALLVVSAALAINGRYLDFPLPLFVLPLLALLLRVASHPQCPLVWRPLDWLLALLAVTASQLAAQVAFAEPGNDTAWMWTGLCALSALVLPLASAQTLTIDEMHSEPESSN